MARSKKRQVFRRSLKLENLERRQLFAADLAPVPVSDLVWHPPLSVHPTPKMPPIVSDASERFETFDSQAELDARLKALLEFAWEDVVGKRVDEVTANSPIYYWDLVSPPMWANDQVQAVTVSEVRLADFRTLTTTRHAGIDEPDQLDATGDGYVYSVIGGSIHAIDLRDPANVVTAPVISVPDFWGQIMVTGDQLLLIKTEYGQFDGESSPYESRTRVTVYDISQRMSPRETGSFFFEGSNSAAYLTDGQLTLVQANSISLPVPDVVQDSQGVERYQSFENYWTDHRDDVYAALLPNWSNLLTNQVDAGDWSDISLARDWLSTSTSILRLDVGDGQLSLLDSETLVGLNAVLTYQAPDDLYIVAESLQASSAIHSNIYRVDAGQDGQLRATGAAKIDGRVNSTTWMNEHEGILQVASLGIVVASPATVEFPSGVRGPEPFLIPAFNRNSANITTLGDGPNGWGVLGQLKDLGDGQSLLAANFMATRPSSPLVMYKPLIHCTASTCRIQPIQWSTANLSFRASQLI